MSHWVYKEAERLCGELAGLPFRFLSDRLLQANLTLEAGAKQ